MSDSTDINSLPLNPVSGGSMEPNIIMHKNELIDNKLESLTQSRDNEIRNIMQQQGQGQQPSGSGYGQNQGQGVSLDQNLINQLINGIQQASLNGQMELPSRDIPQMTTQYTHDSQTKPNYIPNANNNDYIDNLSTPQDIINQTNRRYNKSDSLDVMYDEMQIPILIGILFFIFQLPVFRKYMMTFLPSMFNNDGNYKLKGLIITSSLFSLLFYILKKVLSYLTDVSY
jgi:hypothetical protein